MRKTTDEELNKGQGTKESAETAANNTGVDTAETPQTDELRAYVPAGAAMALAPSPEEEPYYEEGYREDDEDEYDDDDSAVNDIARDMDQESASELLNRYAEQDRLDQESEEGATHEEESEGDPDTAGSEEDESQGQSDVDMKLVEETVNTINTMYRKNVDNGKIEIGELLLDKAFDGKIELAMSTNPQKNKTFAKIAKRLDRLVEPKTLGSWVRAAAAKRDLKKRGVNLPNLTAYHYVELATVRDEDERIKFAKQAELKGWSVKALREAIRKSRSTEKSEAEQLKAEMDASIRRFSDFATDADLTDFASDVESVKEAYPPSKAIELLPAVKKCLTNVRASERLLKEFHGSLSAIVKEATEPLSD